MSTDSNRIYFIDLLRGLAVIAMVFGHTFDALLEPSARATTWFQVYTFMRGFTAPIFLFVSGLAFSVATEKGWERYTRWTPHLRKRLIRIAVLFIVGYALHLPFFSLQKSLTETSTDSLTTFLQTDILQCIAASLLILHILIFLVRTVRRFIWAITGLTAFVIVGTPILWQADFTEQATALIAPYINGLPDSPFPLFPYSAFLFTGILSGHYYLRSRKEGRTGAGPTRLALTAAGCAVAAVIVDIFSPSLYPDPLFWHTSPVFTMMKIAVVLQLVVPFMTREAGRSMPVRGIETLGRASFLIYAVHIVIVYGSAANAGLSSLIGRTLPPPHAAATGILMIVAMGILVLGARYLAANHARVASYGRIALTSVLVYLFLTRPY